MRSGTRAVSVSAREILRRNQSPRSGAAVGAGAGSCDTVVVSSSPIISRLDYNNYASHEVTEIIGLPDRQPDCTDHLWRLSDQNWHPGEEPSLLHGHGFWRDQALAKETKKEPNSTGSKQSGISPCFHAPGILTTRNPGSPPQRRRRSASLKTRQWSA